LVYYDNVGYGDIYLPQFRLGGPETMSRADIRKFYSQTNLARWKPAEDEELKLTESLDQAVLNQLLEQPDYIAEELEVRSLYDEIRDKLEDLQAAGSRQHDEHQEDPDRLLLPSLRQPKGVVLPT
jgi:hypothetical protein